MYIHEGKQISSFNMHTNIILFPINRASHLFLPYIMLFFYFWPSGPAYMNEPEKTGPIHMKYTYSYYDIVYTYVGISYSSCT